MDDQAPAEQNSEKPDAGLPPPEATKTVDARAASPATAEQLTEIEEHSE